jgi:hypothetical protein
MCRSRGDGGFTYAYELLYAYREGWIQKVGWEGPREINFFGTGHDL